MRRVLVALLLSGCVVDLPEEDELRFRCATDADCADGYACSDGFCSDGTTNVARDGGTFADGGTLAGDAGALDGGAVDGAVDGGTDPERDAGTIAMRDGGTCEMTQCGAECVDPLVSAAHCGGCGFDCGGGACANGVCQAFTWQDLPGARPSRLVADATDLYWTTDASNGAVVRRAFDRSTDAQPVALLQPYPDRLVVTDTHVVWTALDQNSGPRPGHIRYRDKALAAPTFEITTATQRSPDGLAVANGTVFWSVDSPLYLRAHTVGDPVDTYDELQFSGGSSYLNAMVADATHIYWFDSGANLFRVPHDLSSTPEPVFTAQEEEPKSAVMDGAWIYFGDSANGLSTQGLLRRVNKTSQITEALAANANPDDSSHGVYELTIDGTNVYYTTEASNGRRGRVYRVPTTGGTPELLEELADPNNASARGIAAHGGFVYWAAWAWSGSSVDGRIVAQRVR